MPIAAIVQGGSFPHLGKDAVPDNEIKNEDEKMKGVYGKVLHIDLQQEANFAEQIPDEIYQSLIGGKGLATHLLYRENKPQIDPLSPENNVIVALGPAVNTKVWGSSRYGLFSKSPLTGVYAESYSGGSVAEYMGNAGYDAFILRGRASRPTVLEISDTGVVFHDAGDIWGKSGKNTRMN